MNELKLPDFDELITLAKDIGDLSRNLVIGKAEKDYLNSTIVKKVTTDSNYFVKANPPAMNFIEGVYKDVGYDEETMVAMSVIIKKIADISGELEYKKNLFLVYRDMISVWRTESANKRGAYLE